MRTPGYRGGGVVRLAGLSLVVLLVAGACTDEVPEGDSGTSAAVSSTTAATTASATTALPPSTTTVQSTTTSTVPPWVHLHDPGMPPVLLALAPGGPEPMTSVCLEIAAGGSAGTDEAWVAMELADAFRLIGVDVVAGVCDATLSITLTGERTSANYMGIGTNSRECWSGYRISGEAVLSVGNDTRKTWTVDGEMPPPNSTTACPDETDPIGFGRWGGMFLEMFFDMFGGVGQLAWTAAWDNGVCRDGTTVPTEVEVQALASLVAANRYHGILEWIKDCVPQGDESREALLPIVPYLIAHLDTWSRNTLEWISGESFNLPGEVVTDAATRREQHDWWVWWEAQQG